MNLSKIKERMWVVQTKGSPGSVGCVDRVIHGKPFITPVALVRFGPDGPIKRLKVTSVRPAARDEIPEGMA